MAASASPPPPPSSHRGPGRVLRVRRPEKCVRDARGYSRRASVPSPEAPSVAGVPADNIGNLRSLGGSEGVGQPLGLQGRGGFIAQQPHGAFREVRSVLSCREEACFGFVFCEPFRSAPHVFGDSFLEKLCGLYLFFAAVNITFF